MRIRMLAAILLTISILSACAAPAQTPTPLPTPTATYTATLVPTATPSPTATPTLTATLTATPTATATATAMPIVTPTEASTPQPTVKPAPGDVDVGSDFRLKSREAILDKLSQPENWNKIVVPVVPSDRSQVVYVASDPFESSGAWYTPLSLFITEADGLDVSVPTTNESFGVSRSDSGAAGIIAIDGFYEKKFAVGELGEIEIAHVWVYFGVDPQFPFDYGSLDLSEFGFGDPIYQHCVPTTWLKSRPDLKAQIMIRIMLKGNRTPLIESQTKELFEQIMLQEGRRLVGLK